MLLESILRIQRLTDDHAGWARIRGRRRFFSAFECVCVRVVIPSGCGVRGVPMVLLSVSLAIANVMPGMTLLYCNMFVRHIFVFNFHISINTRSCRNPNTSLKSPTLRPRHLATRCFPHLTSRREGMFAHPLLPHTLRTDGKLCLFIPSYVGSRNFAERLKVWKRQWSKSPTLGSETFSF
jgi:hypothetical protein